MIYDMRRFCALVYLFIAAEKTGEEIAYGGEEALYAFAYLAYSLAYFPALSTVLAMPTSLSFSSSVSSFSRLRQRDTSWFFCESLRETL